MIYLIVEKEKNFQRHRSSNLCFAQKVLKSTFLPFNPMLSHKSSDEVDDVDIVGGVEGWTVVFLFFILWKSSLSSIIMQ